MDVERIREAAERVAHSEGLEVVDVEWKVGKQRFLRVYIDKPGELAKPSAGGPADALAGVTSPPTSGPAEASGTRSAKASGTGVTHGDCERVSQQLSVILDVEDLVPGPHYILEVSSPGLDRKLRKPEEFERFAGQRARVWLHQGVENTKYFEGRLAGYADGMVRMDVRGREVLLPFADIRKANLVVEI